MRRYGNREVDEYVEAEQHRRQDERLADPRWVMIPDDLTPTLGGGVWRRGEED